MWLSLVLDPWGGSATGVAGAEGSNGQEQVITELGDQAVEIEAEGDVYRRHSLYLASRRRTPETSGALKKFFAAPDQTGADLQAGDHAVIDAVAQATQLDAEILTNVLGEFDHTLRLEDDLADTLATLSVWAQASGKLPESVETESTRPPRRQHSPSTRRGPRVRITRGPRRPRAVIQQRTQQFTA